MKTKVYGIKIQHLTLGLIMSEYFVDPTQFKLFLKLVQGCMELKNDLDFFNGTDFLIHVPHKILKDCVVTTNNSEVTAEQMVRSKIESLVSK
jgi:hypothetical protein